MHAGQSQYILEQLPELSTIYKLEDYLLRNATKD